jgi:tetratricopeptide (TPR) repeat protein
MHENVLKKAWFCAATSLLVAYTSLAQNTITVPNATVATDATSVYSEMATTSEIVATLKKGDGVIVDFDIKTTMKWCSVRLAGQANKLGFVPCQRLTRQQPALANSTPLPGSASDLTAVSPTRHVGKPTAPPPVRAPNGYVEIRNQVIREDTIDIAKLAELEAAAKSGSVAAMNRAAIAHFAAGNFELARNSPDEAIEQFQAGLNFATREPGLQLVNLQSLAYICVVRSQYSTALEYLDRARKIAPNSVGVARLSGWAYSGMNRLSEAATEWQRAQKIEPNEEIAQALERIERDQTAETDFREGQSHHFSVHYQGSATPQLAADILGALEEDFRTLQSQLHFAPADSISVVLYTQETFRDITRAPGWASALNDGRIRVPIQGLTSVTDELSRVLMHELTHSFIEQKTLRRCPTWLQEGLAQYMEGHRSDYSARALVATLDQPLHVPLHRLEGSWSKFPAPLASFAYAWSLAATETIVASSGMYGLERFFEHFENDTAVEPALREALQINYADLERNTADYLRRTYIKE